MIFTIWCLIEKNLIKWSLVIYCFMKKYTHDINSLYLVHCYDYDHLDYSLDWGKKFWIAVKSRSKNFNFISWSSFLSSFPLFIPSLHLFLPFYFPSFFLLFYLPSSLSIFSPSLSSLHPSPSFSPSLFFLPPSSSIWAVYLYYLKKHCTYP